MLAKICRKIFNFWKTMNFFIWPKKRNFGTILAKNVKNQVKIRQKFEIFAKIWSKNGENFLVKIGENFKFLRKFRNFSLDLFKNFRKITENSNVLFK